MGRAKRGAKTCHHLVIPAAARTAHDSNPIFSPPTLARAREPSGLLPPLLSPLSRVITDKLSIWAKNRARNAINEINLIRLHLSLGGRLCLVLAEFAIARKGEELVSHEHT